MRSRAENPTASPKASGGQVLCRNPHRTLNVGGVSGGARGELVLAACLQQPPRDWEHFTQIGLCMLKPAHRVISAITFFPKVCDITAQLLVKTCLGLRQFLVLIPKKLKEFLGRPSVPLQCGGLHRQILVAPCAVCVQLGYLLQLPAL